MNDAQRLKRYLAEEYEEGRMSRRQMIVTVGRILGVTVVSPALLASLGCACPESNVEEPEAAPVPESATEGVTAEPDDPDIEVSEVEVPGEEGAIRAYQARPSSEGPFAAILLIHENRGLKEHTRDVARRFAKLGYTGLAVDLLYRSGGSDQFADEAEATTAISGLDQGGGISGLTSSVTWLQDQTYVQGDRIGAIGWCWGGGQSWRLATEAPRMSAIAAFYGPNPPLEAAPNIQVAMLGIYGGEDARITDQEPELEEALASAAKTYEMKVFDGANHAFFNDTGDRFDPEAAEQAWLDTLNWFDEHL